MKNVEGFFFGEKQQLFGMFHPSTGRPRDHAVVLCPPLFHEYFRAHFALKKIATDLASSGYDVLRFDYSGTGDSKGDLEAAVFEQWSQDIGIAIAEIRSLSGPSVVSLVATRYAAALALPWQSEVANFVGFDPIVDGGDYARDIELIHEGSMQAHLQLSDTDRKRISQDDFLGTGLTRDSILDALTQFDTRIRQIGSLPDRSVAVASETDWAQPHLEAVYAHEAIRQVTGAF